MAEAALGNLGEAKVLIRVDWEKLESDLDQSKKKITSAFEGGGKMMRNVGAAMTAGLTAPLTALIGFSTKAASRVNELQSVNMLLGKSAGYSEDYVKQQAESVQDMGIEAAASQEIVADFIKAELDLADASKIARVAQDAAVIAGKNSTETTKTLTDAIIKGETELFKSAGMIISVNKAHEDYAELVGKSADELTEQEKIQARVNATLAYGERIAGAYATAMKDPGKVLRSYPRYLNDVAVAFGQSFIPAFKEAIFAGKDLLSWLKEAVSEGGALEPVIQKWGERFANAAEFVGDLIEKLDDMDPVIAQTIADIVATGAAMGPVLLVGGQMMIWAVQAAPAIKTLAGAFSMAQTTTLGATAALGGYVALIAAVTAGIIYLNNLASERNALMVDEMQSTANTFDSYDMYVSYLKRVAESKGLLIDKNGNLVNKNRDVIESNYLMTESQWKLNNAIEKGKYPIEMAALDSGYYADQAARAGKSTAILAAEAEEAAEAMVAFDEALSITKNFSAIVSMAEEYDKTLEEIDDKQRRVKQLMEIRQSGGYLDGVWVSAKDARDEIKKLNSDIGDLQQSMEEMANQMVLDMYQATLAIDGYTEAEMQAYFDMAAEMGIISKEASDRAMDNYYAAKHEIENNPVEIDMNDSKLDEVIRKFGDIPREIRTNVITNYSSTGTPPSGGGGGGYTPMPKAEGGPVWSDDIYLVGERGPELFVPNVQGSIIPNDELARAMERMAVNVENGNSRGDVNVQANVNSEIDIHRLAYQIADVIRRR